MLVSINPVYIVLVLGFFFLPNYMALSFIISSIIMSHTSLMICTHFADELPVINWRNLCPFFKKCTS